jgi:hypothetical protein
MQGMKEEFNYDTGNYFLNRTPIAQEIRIEKWDCIKLKIFFATYRMRENLCQLFIG